MPLAKGRDMEKEHSTAPGNDQPRVLRKAYQPNRFDEAFWTFSMTEAWIMFQGPEAVRWIAGTDRDNEFLDLHLKREPLAGMHRWCEKEAIHFEILNAVRGGD